MRRHRGFFVLLAHSGGEAMAISAVVHSLFSWRAHGAAGWYRSAVGRLRKALRKVEMRGWWVLVLCSLFEPSFKPDAEIK